ncbi:MAG TPA: hypothetical protein QF761_15825 [Pirellulales bacterium]|nr:hypothetical protein [Pirellulales bacterium]
MQIAIIHYHLNPGGVTQVIANHLQSLDLALDENIICKVAIFHGGKTKEWNPPFLKKLQNIKVSIHSVAALGYDAWPAEQPDPTGLSDDLLRRLSEMGFDPAETVIHVHNHSLGKNVSLPVALHKLAAAGYPLLLQIHDFAEDFRPEQYARISKALSANQAGPVAGVLYPQASHIHYAVLNGRDCKVLAQSGVAVDRLHELPNPIVEFEQLPAQNKNHKILKEDIGVPVDTPLVLFPVRGIRRKNIGELLMWSALMRTRAFFGVTLAPNNAAELPAYNRWKSLVKEAGLRCIFELGEKLSFQESLAAADALITTSVAEGFGMVFLEAQLAGRSLLGRKLPEITDDFEQNHIDLPFLYDRFAVPVDLIGRDHLRQQIVAAYQKTISAFDRQSYNGPDLNDCFDRLIADGTIDFAMLTPEMQSRLILKASDSDQCCEKLLNENPLVSVAQDRITELQVVLQNAAAVRAHYRPLSCGQRLLNIYRGLLAADREEAATVLARCNELLEFFLKIERFRPVRSMS